MLTPSQEPDLEQLCCGVALKALQFTGYLWSGKACDMESVLVVGHLNAASGANCLNLPHCRIRQAEVNRGALALQNLLDGATQRAKTKPRRRRNP